MSNAARREPCPIPAVTTLHHAMTVTTATCWDNPAFETYWAAIEDATGDHCWDTSPMLDLIVEQFNAGTPIPEAAALLKEADDHAAYDAYMSIPPWDR